MKATLKKSLPNKNQERIHLLMGISSGFNHQSGEKFLCFVDMVNALQDQIRLVSLLLTGYLHRYYITLSHEHPEEETQKLNQQWLNANQVYLNDLKVPYNIILWENLLQKRSFQKGLVDVNQLYQSDNHFQQIIDTIANKYANKLFNQIKEQTPEKPFSFTTSTKICREYCIEESAVLFALIELGIDAQVYPGKWNQAMQYVYENLIPGDPLPWIEYRLR